MISRGVRNAVLAHAFLIQAAAYIIRPTASYQALERGADLAFIGAIAASFAIVPLVMALWAGRWVDRGHSGIAFVAGAGLMILGGALLLVPGVPLWAMLLLNAVIGFGHLVGVIAEQSAVGQVAEARRDSAYGLYTFVGTLGQALAPLAIAAVGGSAIVPPTQSLLWIYLAVCLAMLGVSLVLTRQRMRTADATPPRLRAALSVPRADRAPLVGSIAASMFVLAAVDLIQVYLPALGIERGLPVAVVGALLAVRAAATMLSRLFLGRLSRWAGRGRLVIVSTLVSALTIAPLGLDIPVVAMGALLAVAGFALGVSQPLAMTIVSITAPPGTLATWLAMRLTANRLSQAVVPVTVGAIVAGSGAGAVFLLTGGLLFVTGVAVAGALRRV